MGRPTNAALLRLLHKGVPADAAAAAAAAVDLQWVDFCVRCWIVACNVGYRAAYYLLLACMRGGGDLYVSCKGW